MEQSKSKIQQLRNMCGDLNSFLKANFKSLSDVEITLTISKEDIDKISEELFKESASSILIYPDNIPAVPKRFTQIRFYPFTLINLKEEKSNGTESIQR
jgi:hypothetical protein